MLAMDCLKEFKLECEIKNFSPRTIKGYYNNNALFLTFCSKEDGINQIEEVRLPHIKKYVQFLTKSDRKPTYVNGILKTIRAFFKYCYELEYISSNPAAKVPWQKEGEVLINTFSDEEVKRLINAFDYSNYLQARNKLILIIAFDTGMRNTEICDMLNEDIRDNYLLVHGKGSKERNVAISPILKKAMIRYQRIRDQYFKNKVLHYQNYLLSRTARPLTKEAIEHIFNQANEKAHVRSEIRCSPHTARHYFAQANLRNGLDIYSLSRLMGHCNTNITKTYLQSLKDAEIVELAMKSSPLMNL